MNRNDRRVLDARDEAGVSAVIGAVLVFGLMSSAFVIWSFTTLPVWIADNEEAREVDVERSFAALRSGLDLLSADGSAGPITASLPLSADEVPLLQPVPSIGSLRYETGFGWHGTFQSATSHLVDGLVDGDPSATISGAQHTSVLELDALTLSIDGITGDTITITATDGASNVVTLTLTLAVNTNCGGNAIETTVSGPFTSDRKHVTCSGAALTNQIFDVLDPDVGFTSQVNRLSGDFTLDFSTSTSSTYGAVWRTSQGAILTAGTGVSAGTAERELDTGRLVFDPVTLHAIDRDTIWEGGSILRAQSDGTAVASSPDFNLTVTGSTGYLRWTVVDLSGSGDVGGAGIADVSMTYTGQDERLVSTTTGATILIDSSHSTGWSSFLNSQILVGGATGGATVTQGTNQTTLTLSPGGGITEWIVHYRVLSANAVVGT